MQMLLIGYCNLFRVVRDSWILLIPIDPRSLQIDSKHLRSHNQYGAIDGANSRKRNAMLNVARRERYGNMVMFEGQRNYERTGHGVKSDGTKETSSVIPFNFTVRKLSVRARAPESTITLSPPILRVFEFLRVVKARDISRDLRGMGEENRRNSTLILFDIQIGHTEHGNCDARGNLRSPCSRRIV